ncbi:MAG: tRNA guanosine(15) transglycosylase TgtA [Thermoprotei archaeon]|nr:tRNA guanosine(15) transglycosylase TgtA [Thermoprotei archaeon]
MFTVKDIDLAGRIGLLKTKSGPIETPTFLPVIDPARQELPLSDIESAGFNQVITNAYLILKRFGGKAVDLGIHGVLGFKGIVMTDSGAYQILEYGDIEYSQETIIEYQKNIGSDIAVILDVPTGDVAYEEAKLTVEETLRRAREALELIKDTKPLWVLPIQGGKYLDLVSLSAREAAKLPGYSIYGIGSPTVFFERYELTTVLDMIHTAKRILPPGKPVHLFGAGHPLVFPFAIALGVDTFDSASYILYARDGRYIVDHGVYRLEDLEYLPCSCPVCSRRSPGDLLEAGHAERTRLLALHNLYVIRRSLDNVKQAIREGRLWELLEEVSRRHPKALEALRKFRKYYKYVEAQTPRVKGRIYGVRLYDVESLWNPKILRFRLKTLTILDSLLETVESITLTPLAGNEKECLSDLIDVGRSMKIYYEPFIGIIPRELCGTYPTTQHLTPKTLSQPVVEDLANTLRVLYSKARARGVPVTLVYCDRIWWHSILAGEASSLGVNVRVECG